MNDELTQAPQGGATEDTTLAAQAEAPAQSDGVLTREWLEERLDQFSKGHNEALQKRMAETLDAKLRKMFGGDDPDGDPRPESDPRQQQGLTRDEVLRLTQQNYELGVMLGQLPSDLREEAMAIEDFDERLRFAQIAARLSDRMAPPATTDDDQPAAKATGSATRVKDEGSRQGGPGVRPRLPASRKELWELKRKDPKRFARVREYLDEHPEERARLYRG